MLRDHRAATGRDGNGVRSHEAPMPAALGMLTAILPFVIIVAVSLVALLSQPGLRWVSMLAAAPALAAVRYTPRGVLLIGGASALLATVLGMRAHLTVDDRPQVISALVVVTLVSSLVSYLRLREEKILAAVRSVAETAQHAVLAPVPAQVGSLRCAVSYHAAAAEARIGGDLYAVVDTVYGVRAIMADVRGKGLPAVRMASLVNGVFREAAYDEPDLVDVVNRIERSLSRNVGTDDFVTAVVVGFRSPGTLEIVNCGHEPPILVRQGNVTELVPLSPTPPLGLAALARVPPTLEKFPFAAKDQLLLLTDGVTEARDSDGVFYPLTERLSHHLTTTPEGTLASLQEEVISYVGGRLQDDAAMLLLERLPD